MVSVNSGERVDNINDVEHIGYEQNREHLNRSDALCFAHTVTV